METRTIDADTIVYFSDRLIASLEELEPLSSDVRLQNAPNNDVARPFFVPVDLIENEDVFSSDGSRMFPYRGLHMPSADDRDQHEYEDVKTDNSRQTQKYSLFSLPNPLNDTLMRRRTQ